MAQRCLPALDESFMSLAFSISSQSWFSSNYNFTANVADHSTFVPKPSFRPHIPVSVIDDKQNRGKGLEGLEGVVHMRLDPGNGHKKCPRNRRRSPASIVRSHTSLDQPGNSVAFSSSNCAGLSNCRPTTSCPFIWSPESGLGYLARVPSRL